jgi:tRNA(Ile)-lysidine synthase
MLRGGERVLIGVSGGPDSVALLHCLVTLRPVLDLDLVVAHVDHGLRPEAAAEAARVTARAEAWGVPAVVERVHLRSRGARGPGEEPWAGPEAEARRARLAALAARAGALGAQRIALGHTADDQAETVVMRLLAGAGPLGLGGIPPVRGPYVRPLIETTRAEVLAHLVRHGLDWADDPTNRDPAFLRNRVRHDVLPFLAAGWDPGAAAALCRGAAVARALQRELVERAAAGLATMSRAAGPGALELDGTALAALPADLGAETLRLAVARVAPGLPLRGPARRALAQAAAGRGRGPLRLGPVTIERSGRRLRVATAALPPLRERAWSPPGRLPLDEIGAVLLARRCPRPADGPLEAGPEGAVFDADALPPTLLVRSRRPGDRLVRPGAPGHLRLKTLMAEAGVPRWERDRVPLLVAGDEILWAPGLGRGRAAPVTDRTRCILAVTLERGEAARPW